MSSEDANIRGGHFNKFNLFRHQLWIEGDKRAAMKYSGRTGGDTGTALFAWVG